MSRLVGWMFFSTAIGIHSAGREGSNRNRKRRRDSARAGAMFAPYPTASKSFPNEEFTRIEQPPLQLFHAVNGSRYTGRVWIRILKRYD